ncbi:MAG: Rpn family recombination-promoting nuclease/putative transposase [Methylococcales bacterium]
MKFLDIKTDFAFKKVFGSNESKEILINFLNAVIIFNDNQQIKSLAIVDPYNIPMLKGMKDTYVDVKAVLGNGSHVIIEMQVLNTEGFEKRILYNAAKKYSSQLKKGEDYKLLNPVIALTITDFTLFKEQQDVISRFKLIEKDQLIDYMDDIELIFIELPKFTKTEKELTGIQDKWIYFIKNAGALDYIPKNLNKELEKAFQIANEANFSEMELELQHRKKDWVYMQKSSLELAKKQGIEQGMEQGMEKGIEQGVAQKNKQIVIKSLKAGLDRPLIHQITGLNEKQLTAIINQYDLDN